MKLEWRHKRLWLLTLASWLGLCSLAWTSPVDITDDAGKTIHFNQCPRRVVSLVPSATEIIFAINAEDALCGITHHSASLRGAADKPIVGGFFSPSAERVMALKPDLVIVSSLHAKLRERFDDSLTLMVMHTRHMDDAFRHIRLLGTLFDRSADADALIEKNRRMLDLVARKVAMIPEQRRKRVMRLMGSEQLLTPGNDSFQNEMIRAAGGIPPDLGKSGAVMPVSQQAWVSFNPQVVYGCGRDCEAAKAVLKGDGWNRAEAVENSKIYTLPCDLTCRAGAHLGDFVAWLAALIYAEEFADPGREVLPRQVFHTRPITLDLPYVQKAAIATSTGTDNIIVVGGNGAAVDNAGGHSKMGELIARTAYAAVREAIAKQNGMLGRQDVFQWLRERHLGISRLATGIDCSCRGGENSLVSRVEQTLLNPAYAGFLETAMAISDATGRGTVNDLRWYEEWCLDMAGQIAGRRVETLNDYFLGRDMPVPLAMALNAVFTEVSVDGGQ